MLDPEYGLAWAGIADTYSLLGYYGQIPPEEARAKAREAVAKALQFAPDLAETHTSSGLFNLLYEWNWAEAERSFLRALEVNPGYIQGAGWYGLFYLGFACGRWDEAIVVLKECWTRDNLSGYAAAVVGIAYATAFHDPVAYEWSDRATALDPDAFLSIWLRQLAAGSMGDWARGIDVATLSMHVHGRQNLQLTNLGMLYFESGDAALARSVYDELRSRAPREHIPPTAIGILAAALGERQVAVACVGEALRRHDPQLVIFSHGWLGSQHLRDLPEHQQALRAIGLMQWVETRS
jgi:tetratricopeptide (TPR) repeat protein